jgi:hypothetical protein
MARTRFTASGGLQRWVGTLEDVVEAFDLAVRLVGKVGSCDAVINVEQPGLTREYESPREMADDTTPEDLRRMESAALYATRTGQGETNDDNTLSVSVNFMPHRYLSDAASVRVAGPDRTDTEGIYAQLIERLNEGRRFPRSGGGAVAAIVTPVVTGAVFITTLSTDFMYNATKDWSGLVAGVVFVVSLFLVAVITGGPWLLLFPRFEWLDSEQRTIWQRWRKKVGAAMLFILAATATAVIGRVVGVIE